MQRFLRVAVGLAALVAGARCYRPSYGECELACAADRSCPSGLVCSGTMCGLDVGACTTTGTIDAPGAGPDGPDVGTGFDAPVGGVCWSTFTPTNFDPCGNGFPLVEEFPGSGGTIDTDDPTCAYMFEAASAVCAHHYATASLGVNGTIEVVGSRPLILAIDGNAVIAGNIIFDGSAASAQGRCMGNPGSPGSSNGGGGGAGASFGTQGGSGARGLPSGGAGAASGAATAGTLSPLAIACNGGTGGLAGSLAGGAGGVSGGTIEISAQQTLTVAGQVFADGGGATGGLQASGNPGASGGGGGGAGGGLFLEANSVIVDSGAALCAVGGGGGAGAVGDTSPGAAGSPGLVCSIGTGGTGGAAGNAGGSGGGSADAGPGATAVAMSNSLGGGGGGGGAGAIRIRSQMTAIVDGRIIPDAHVDQSSSLR